MGCFLTVFDRDTGRLALSALVLFALSVFHAAALSFVTPVTGTAAVGGGLDTRYSADAMAADDELVDTRYWAEAWSLESVLDTKTPVGTFLMIR